MHQSEAKLQSTLLMLQLRLSVHAGHRLTHAELAEMAGVGGRSFGEWIRGTTAPPGALALLRLLSALPVEELSSVLEAWKPCKLPLDASNARKATARKRLDKEKK